MSCQSKPVGYTLTRNAKTDPIVPINELDRVFCSASVDPATLHITYYDMYNGYILKNSADWRAMFTEGVYNVEHKLYPTTDHVPFSIKVDGITFIYLSLDSAVRTVTEGVPLHVRLPNFYRLIRNIISQTTGPCVVYMSEACRKSFTGTTADPKDIKYWFEIRQSFYKECGLNFLTEQRHNTLVTDTMKGTPERPQCPDMSFGVSAFYTDNAIPFIKSYYTELLTTEGNGSGCVIVRTINDEHVIGVHFPLQFPTFVPATAELPSYYKNDGEDNLGYKAMTGLQNIMRKYKSKYAFGDCNTIPGKIMNCICAAIDNTEFGFVDVHIDGIPGGKPLTFAGSWFDTIPEKRRQDDDWKFILDEF